MEGPIRKSSRKHKEEEQPTVRTQGGAAITDIPEHILMEICARLSVRSICRCRCVCKYWSSMLTGASFSKLHFERAPTCPLFRNDMFSSKSSLYLFEIERDNYFNARGNLNLNTVFKLPKHAKFPDGVKIVNSCNGILCMQSMFNYYPIAIYNPVTGEYSILPVPEDARKADVVAVHGLGFCPTSNLYKVLLTVTNISATCIGCANSSDCRDRTALVYTFGPGGGWRKIEKIPCFHFFKTQYPVIRFFKKEYPVFLNGALHWLVTTPELEAINIISFDLESEKFCLLPAPDVYLRPLRRETGVIDIGDLSLSLGVIKGQLYLVESMYAHGVKKVELWVLKDYGVRNSWTKEHLVDVFAAGENGESWSPWTCQSIDFSNSWDFLFYSRHKKIIYFTDKHKGMRCLKIGKTRSSIEAYVPSFYSIKGIVADSLQVLNVRSM